MISESRKIRRLEARLREVPPEKAVRLILNPNSIVMWDWTDHYLPNPERRARPSYFEPHIPVRITLPARNMVLPLKGSRHEFGFQYSRLPPPYEAIGFPAVKFGEYSVILFPHPNFRQPFTKFPDINLVCVEDFEVI